MIQIKAMVVVRCLCSLLFASASSATLTVRNVANDESKTYPSAVFRYLSDHENKRLENYQVIPLEGKDLCNPRRELVDGKIVLANLAVGAVIDCWPVEAARSCAMYGAVAFVTISFYSPPGLVSNIHWTFNPNDESVGIPYAGITAVDVGDVELKLWRSSLMDGMVATLAPPYIRVYSDLFESPLWLIVFQILLPACAFLVSSESIAEIRRRILMHTHGRSFRLQGGAIDQTMLTSAPTLICVVEALSCAAIGAILVLGEFGPLYLPYSFHYFFMLLLTGSSFFTTLVAALILHEKSKFVAGLPSRNDISTFYRKTIGASALTCIGSDIVIGGLTASDPRAAYGNFTIYFGIYGFGQIIVALYFFTQAWAFYEPLLLYLSHPESHPRPENEAQIKFIARLLTLSGSAMLLNTSAMVFIAIMATGDIRVTNAFVWFITMFLFSASRIGISYCQVSIHTLHY